MKRNNPERKKRMRTDPDGFQHTYGEYHEFVKTLRCCLTGKSGPHAHHIKSVKSGGRDFGNQIPLAPTLHSELHQIGPSRFQEKYDIDILVEAQKVLDLWKARRRGARLSRWSCQCADPAGKYFCARCGNVIPEDHDGD
jgi:hypothetical protein